MKTIKTALPLPAQVMVEFFKDKKGVFFEIDYEQSIKNLRTPQAILNYVANLKLNAELVVDKIPVELLAAYSTMRDVVSIKSLTRVHANLLYFCKYSDILYEDTLERFSLEDIVEYLKANAEQTLIQLALLNSLPLYVATSMNSDPDTDRSAHELVSVVDEQVHPAISVNLFQLFTYEDFVIRFLEQSVPIENQIYFKPHFDSNMYGGRTMFGWFAVSGNMYFALCQLVNEKSYHGVDRFELTNLYTSMLTLNNDAEALTSLSSQIEQAGGLKSFLGLTRMDDAELKRRARRAKKLAKRQVANVQA